MDKELTIMDRIKSLFCRLGTHFDVAFTIGNYLRCYHCGSNWRYSHRYKLMAFGKRGDYEN